VSNKQKDLRDQNGPTTPGRRKLLIGGLGLAAASVAGWARWKCPPSGLAA